MANKITKSLKTPKTSPKASKSPQTFKTSNSSKTPKVTKVSKPTEKTKAPRQGSSQAKDPRNYTSFREDQKDWSWENLPEILYQFKPTEADERKDLAEPKKKWANNKWVRDIEVLPDHISSNVEEFRVEAWMRLDRRIQLQDLIDRMEGGFEIAKNALQQRNVRFRKDFNLIAWGSGNKTSLKLEEIVVERLVAAGIDPTRNSTRGITPGLINPDLGEAGGRVPIPNKWGFGRRGHQGGRALSEQVEASEVVGDEAIEEEEEVTSVIDLTSEYEPLTPPRSSSDLLSGEDVDMVIDVDALPTPRGVSSSPEAEQLPSSPAESLEEDDFLFDAEAYTRTFWDEGKLFRPSEETPGVLRATFASKVERRAAPTRALPFCDFECLYGKFERNSSLDDVFNIVTPPPQVRPEPVGYMPPSFGLEPIKFPIAYKPGMSEPERRERDKVTLGEYYAGSRYAFEMPHVPGVI